MKKLLLILMIAPLLFISCNKDDDTPDNNNNNTLVSQNLYSVIDISNSPVRTYSSMFGNSITSFQVLNGNFQYTTDTFTLNWISGEIMSIVMSLATADQIIGCADVEIRTYNNNNLVNTENFQIGHSQLSPPIFCDNLVAGNSFSKTLQIVAD